MKHPPSLTVILVSPHAVILDHRSLIVVMIPPSVLALLFDPFASPKLGDFIHHVLVRDTYHFIEFLVEN